MWLLKEETARALVEARRLGMAPSEAQVTAFVESTTAARESGRPRNLTVAGDVAEIAIDGVLTKTPDLFAMLFGGGNTAYVDIVASLREAEANPSIKRIVLNVSSGGGSVDGLFDTLAALESVSKPMTAKASLAASAAYAIASMASKIEATNAAAEFGSIGVAARYFVYDDEVNITSTDAPNKRPDVTTEEGKAVVREELDAIHELFVDAIARGRKTTAENVNANFGRGGVLLAGEAKRRGMVDSVAKPRLRAVADAESEVVAEQQQEPIVSAITEESFSMNLSELKSKHPDTYKELCAEVLAGERDRVAGHVTLGRQSGDHETMFAAIADGTGFTAAVQAKYLAAGMNRRDQENRQAETNAAGVAADGANQSNNEATKDVGDEAVAILLAKRGLAPKDGK